MSALHARAQALLEDDPYVQSQGIELICIDETSSVLEMMITADQRSFLQAAHGGCLFSLADTAFGLTANCAGTVSVGIDTHMAYIRGCEVGDRIRAEAHEVSRSRRTAIYRVNLSRDGDVVATFTGTVYITRRNLENIVQAP